MLTEENKGCYTTSQKQGAPYSKWKSQDPPQPVFDQTLRPAWLNRLSLSVCAIWVNNGDC